jgi:hypothetical protein
VTAENALSFARFCITERALCYLFGKTQPSCVKTVQVTGKPLVLGIQFLKLQKDELTDLAQEDVGRVKPVKLVAMDGQMAFAAVLPCVFLINGHADQVRHDLCQPVIVIALHPDDLSVMFGIGKFPDMPKEFPVFFGEAAEIQVSKDITQ